MAISLIWLCPASMLMVVAVLLFTIRMSLRKKALATYVAVAMSGVIVILVGLAFDEYRGDQNTCFVILLPLLIFAPVAAWANYRGYKHARELLHRGYVATLPKWMQNIYRYFYDVDD